MRIIVFNFREIKIFAYSQEAAIEKAREFLKSRGEPVLTNEEISKELKISKKDDLECPHGVYPRFVCDECEVENNWRISNNMQKMSSLTYRDALDEGDFKTVGEYLKEYTKDIFDVPMSVLNKEKR